MTNKLFTILLIFLFASTKMEANPIPFTLVKKSIIVLATVDDISGYFIVDTGTPYLILNDYYFNGSVTDHSIKGLVGNEMNIYKNEVNLKISNLNLNRVEAVVLPLDHLCQTKGVNLLGLIGTNVLKYFKMTIDFDTSELELHQVGKKPEAEQFSNAPDVSFEFRWRGGMPIINTEVGNSKVVLGLDTGAGINVLDHQKGAQLAGHLTMNKTVEVFGLDSESESLQSGLLHNVTIENYYCPEMKVVLASMERFKGVHSDLNLVDGLLGYEFLKHFRSVINFKKGRIDLYQRSHSVEKYMVAR